jgi:hypothetical protein
MCPDNNHALMTQHGCHSIFLSRISIGGGIVPGCPAGGGGGKSAHARCTAAAAHDHQQSATSLVPPQSAQRTRSLVQTLPLQPAVRKGMRVLLHVLLCLGQSLHWHSGIRRYAWSAKCAGQRLHGTTMIVAAFHLQEIADAHVVEVRRHEQQLAWTRAHGVPEFSCIHTATCSGSLAPCNTAQQR